MSDRRRRLAVAGAVFSVVLTLALVDGSPPQAAARLLGTVPAPPRSHSRLPYVPGQLLVEYRAALTAAQLRDAAHEKGAAVVRRLQSDPAAKRTFVLVHTAGPSAQELMQRFAADPDVIAVSRNYYRHVDAAPDDPGLAWQWGLPEVDIPDAWHVSTGAPDVVVASVDTGVDLLHPDLVAHLWHNPEENPDNHIDDDGDGYVDDVYGIDVVNHDSVPMDDYGHGTHTSAIMAGVTGNGEGVAGVCPQAQVMALKFIDRWGWGTDAGAIECVDYVTDKKLHHGVNVVAINASWGGFRGDLVLHDAIERAGEAGIVFCAAAGNYGDDNDEDSFYPASYDCPNIIAVAATGPRGRLAGFSDFGYCTVDIAAPGMGVLSAVTGDGYQFWSGTSMATPFVTGTVALCAAAYPGETAEQRVDRILSSARQTAALYQRCTTGGTLDVAAALGLADPTGDTTPPVTTAVGADDLVHSAPVTLSLWADDGAGGSGVAATQWRLDGQPWTAGDVVEVTAPRDATADRLVEYFSTDRAGNVEPVRQTIAHFDMRGPADDALPGVPLSASPFTGTVSAPTDRYDVYRLRLAAGESFVATVSGAPGADVNASLVQRTRRGELVKARCSATSEGRLTRTLAYRARVASTYSLILSTRARGQAYAVAWTIAPPGVDVVPPSIRCVGQPVDKKGHAVWTNRPVTLSFTGSDPGGSGVASYASSGDDGFSWDAGQTRTIDAPSDHSADGWKDILVRATDVAGNVSAVEHCSFGIDTRGPSTEAWAQEAVGRGGPAWVGFNIDDAAGRVWCQLVVKDASTGAVVKRTTLGWRWTGDDWGWAPGELFTDQTWITADMPRGTYDVLIAGGTHDQAGNLWEDAVCRQQMVVR